MGAKLGKMIANRRAKLELSLSQIAAMVGVSYPAVQQWEKGKTNPSRENLPKLASALNTSVGVLDEALAADLQTGEAAGDEDMLIFEEEDQLIVEREAESGENPSVYGLRKMIGTVPKWDVSPQMPMSEREKLEERFKQRRAELENGGEIYIKVQKHLPVYGIVFAGPSEKGEFYFNGEIADYVDRPRGLIYAKNAYCVYVVSDSMIPKFEPNELVFVNPDRPAVANDYVVVELHPEPGMATGPGYLKRLVRRSPSVVLLEQFHPAETFEIAMSAVKSIHRVVPWQELL